jgi:PfaD family protein
MRETRHAGTAWWIGDTISASNADLSDALARVGQTFVLLSSAQGRSRIGTNGQLVLGTHPHESAAERVTAIVTASRLEDLGDSTFTADRNLRYAYIAGAMANGISSVELVLAMGRAGMLGMFGAAGLMPAEIEDALDTIATRLGHNAWGSNLIHNPFEPDLESAVADLYIRRGVRLVSASAYVDLTLPLLRYRFHGIHRDPAGNVVTPNHVLGKLSREEVALRFLSPPPTRMLAELVTRGDLTADQAEMAATLPVAQDLIAEADSGGHTDNQPALAQLPTLLALRDRMQREHGYAVPLRVGAAGGIATPHSAAAAFAMGAAFVVTGSINQACLESGTSDTVREMLANAGQADVTMAPAADMFEMGVDLQVLKRGTMFAMRAQKLRRLYRNHGSLDEIPADERAKLEKAVFRAPLDEIWTQAETFWRKRDPGQLERAARDPKHKMALVFRWYLGMSSRWANRGEHGRHADYQVWCGPAMGAFNQWVRGSFLEDWRARRAPVAAMNILHGAAVLARINTISAQGAALEPTLCDLSPKPLADLEEYLR